MRQVDYFNFYIETPLIIGAGKNLNLKWEFSQTIQVTELNKGMVWLSRNIFNLFLLRRFRF